jgi:DNA adenine methylase
MGSKSRIAKDIVPIIQKCIDDNNIDTYIEPFCGGLNIIDKINCKNKIAMDKHKYLIALFKNLDKINQLPEFITKEHYSEVRDCFNKNLNTYEDWYIGAIGFLASYNGRFFDGGYAGLVNTKAGTTRNYYDEAKRNLIEQIPSLKGIDFIWDEYNGIQNGTFNYPVLIYCDPPYKDTKQYGVSKNFNHDEFWDWVRETSKNNIVIVSECQAPDDFKCIWQQEVLRSIDNNKRVSSTEKLFIYNN